MGFVRLCSLHKGGSSAALGEDAQEDGSGGLLFDPSWLIMGGADHLVGSPEKHLVSGLEVQRP